jgi:hypothetical protein
VRISSPDVRELTLAYLDNARGCHGTRLWWWPVSGSKCICTNVGRTTHPKTLGFWQGQRYVLPSGADGEEQRSPAVSIYSCFACQPSLALLPGTPEILQCAAPGAATHGRDIHRTVTMRNNPRKCMQVLAFLDRVEKGKKSTVPRVFAYMQLTLKRRKFREYSCSRLDACELARSCVRLVLQTHARIVMCPESEAFTERDLSSRFLSCLYVPVYRQIRFMTMCIHKACVSASASMKPGSWFCLCVHVYVIKDVQYTYISDSVRSKTCA